MTKIRRIHITGFFFTVIAGSLLHFVYEWFGGTVAAVFGTVNESIWEHLKLLFWPQTLFSVLEYALYGKKFNGFLPLKVASALIGMLSIIVIFYTYTGILGTHVAFIDISIFIIAVYISYCFSWKQIQEPNRFWTAPPTKIAALFILSALVFCFIFFTFYPPHIGLFAIP